MSGKEKIIKLFVSNVLDKSPDISSFNQDHDGSEGHWLERQFDIKANGDNSPDIYGYELKKDTTSKTTFGDWSANRYIFYKGEYSNLFEGETKKEKQNSFLKIFGTPNQDKNNRCSWSGKVCPKIGEYNEFGQKLIITEDNDICAIYSYEKDQRANKQEIIPKELQKIDKLILAKWFGETSPSSKRRDKNLKSKLEDKFNQKGWFTCKRDDNGVYKEICFGKPINFDEWIKWVKEGDVFFDSGMYEGNARPYSQWRANNTFWDKLINERLTINEINLRYKLK